MLKKIRGVEISKEGGGGGGECKIYILRITEELCENSSQLSQLSCCSVLHIFAVLMFLLIFVYFVISAKK